MTFRLDRWCRDDPLAMSFRVLFSIAIDQEAWVDKVWEQAGENGFWNLVFSGWFND